MNGHPPITIHQEDRKDYYSALEAWDESQELTQMVQFLERAGCQDMGEASIKKRGDFEQTVCKEESALVKRVFPVLA